MKKVLSGLACVAVLFCASTGHVEELLKGDYMAMQKEFFKKDMSLDSFLYFTNLAIHSNIDRETTATAYAMRSVMHSRRGKLDKALADAKTSVEIQPTNDGYDALMDAYALNGNYAAALATAEAAAGLFASDSKAKDFFNKYQRIFTSLLHPVDAGVLYREFAVTPPAAAEQYKGKCIGITGVLSGRYSSISPDKNKYALYLIFLTKEGQEIQCILTYGSITQHVAIQLKPGMRVVASCEFESFTDGKLVLQSGIIYAPEETIKQGNGDAATALAVQGNAQPQTDAARDPADAVEGDHFSQIGVDGLELIKNSNGSADGLLKGMSLVWYAASQKDLPSMKLLGELSYSGVILPQDFKRARYYYTRVLREAPGKPCDVLRPLCEMLLLGLGIDQNIQEAERILSVNACENDWNEGLAKSAIPTLRKTAAPHPGFEPRHMPDLTAYGLAGPFPQVDIAAVCRYGESKELLLQLLRGK